MKQGIGASFVAAVVAVGCWVCVSTFWATPSYAQTSGATLDMSGNPIIEAYLKAGAAGGAFVSNPLPESAGVKYTLVGDANLDGVVSGDDFTILVGNLGKTISTWDSGDFNYNGVVTGDDFTILAQNLSKGNNAGSLNNTGGVPAADYAAIADFASANGLVASVPEPATLGLLALSGLGILARRRRSI